MANCSANAKDTELQSQWAEIQRLPTPQQIRFSLFHEFGCGEGDLNPKPNNVRRCLIDVTKLQAPDCHLLIHNLIKHVENDNLLLLHNIRKRLDQVGVKLPSVEVRYKNLSISAECEVVHGKPLPTLRNYLQSKLLVIPWLLSTSQASNISIIKDVSGIIKPGRFTLLLGPPGCGKTTFMMALAGRLKHSLKSMGEISYNGYRLEEFIPQKTAAYVSQHERHIPEMTVRETLDFSAQCQGVGSRKETMMEILRREKQHGIVPDHNVDLYMKAVSVKGHKNSLQTDYILKILGLEICADTLVGDAMRIGISGGQKRRLTTGEMIVGPARALILDEISNGLDSTTTFQIVSFLQHLAHITDATVVVSLLQPAPETFDLFDDIILMAEGKIVYQGPRTQVLGFFEDCGFKCPQRKGAADFLQEVISRKDQEQYWYHKDLPYQFVTVDQFITKYKESPLGQSSDIELLIPYDKSLDQNNALSFTMFSLSKWELFKACMMREYLLMRRNSFIYVFKAIQLVVLASISMTVFLHPGKTFDVVNGNYFMGSIFYSLLILVVDAIPELSFTVSRIAVFYKQKELCFYPAWAYAIPAAILKVPLSFVAALVWTSLTYYVIGYTPEVKRFLCQFLSLFAVHQMSLSGFRFIASLFQTFVASFTAGNVFIITISLFGGFIIPRPYLPAWLKWGFWATPLTYGEIGMAVNEFLSPRWQKVMSSNITVGRLTLETRGLNFDAYFYWISIASLFLFIIIFNVGFTLALTFLKPQGTSRAIISFGKFYQRQRGENSNPADAINKVVRESIKGRMVLPFEPLTVSFQNVQYYVDVPLQMKKRGFVEKKLQLLRDITGSFRPGVLTAIMGTSGAGKTTLLDVLSGRKTGGIIEGQIKIGGYPKVQSTFARISGYCEQTDTHSPLITVEESIIFSAWLRLPPEIDSNTKAEFVNEVLDTIELDGIKDSLVGLPGVSGLSIEQRKRLTIAVELVSNPSIIFMDEPTSGLDARSAAIVMRAVKNVGTTGRTVVCTIHQPSIDIFEAFDELILMSTGGRIIYSGPLGQQSCRAIEYFEKIPGVPRIKDNYNPATWMIEVTSSSVEAELGMDFEKIYRASTLYEDNIELVKQLSGPSPGSKELHFPARYTRTIWGQFKACLWKHHLSYWRNPTYNVTRILFVGGFSLLFGVLYWQQGRKIENEEGLFNMMGFMYMSTVFFGINNCSSIFPYIATERTVLYREKFAGMYCSWAYSLAQVFVEIPYLLTQALLYVIITYPMIGFYRSATKIFWAFFTMFCTLQYFTYLGMLLTSLTPNIHVAPMLASFCYTIMHLFSGLMIPKPRIPKWWRWFPYLCPSSWTLNAMLTSQYGDIHMETFVFGGRKTVATFLKDYFGKTELPEEVTCKSCICRVRMSYLMYW